MGGTLQAARSCQCGAKRGRSDHLSWNSFDRFRHQSASRPGRNSRRIPNPMIEENARLQRTRHPPARRRSRHRLGTAISTAVFFDEHGGVRRGLLYRRVRPRAAARRGARHRGARSAPPWNTIDGQGSEDIRCVEIRSRVHQGAHAEAVAADTAVKWSATITSSVSRSATAG